MPIWYGVKCKLGGENIQLARVTPLQAWEIDFYAVPTDTISCSGCGGSFLYGPEDAIRFEQSPEDARPT